MMLILSLVVVAILGVVLYSLLVRRSPNRAFVPMLLPGVILLGLAGFGMLRLLPADTDDHTIRTFVALTLLWFGWIGLSALVAQMLNRRMPDLSPMPVAVGALATLAPVAGFLIARAF